MTTTHERIVVLHKPTKREKELLHGKRVEIIQPEQVDTMGQVSVRLLEGDEQDREFWIHPLRLMEIELTPFEPNTKGDA